jgi:hypothetical protein
MIPLSLSRISAEKKFALIIEKCYMMKFGGSAYNDIKDYIEKDISNNSIFAYCTKRSKKIGKIRTGFFSIAKELRIPILPIFIRSHGKHALFQTGQPFMVNDVSQSIFRMREFYMENLKKLFSYNDSDK